MPSPPMFTQRSFPRNIPTVIYISVPFVCVGGRERMLLVTMITFALLAWLDCGKKKRGLAYAWGGGVVKFMENIQSCSAQLKVKCIILHIVKEESQQLHVCLIVAVSLCIRL